MATFSAMQRAAAAVASLPAVHLSRPVSHRTLLPAVPSFSATSICARGNCYACLPKSTDRRPDAFFNVSDPPCHKQQSNTFYSFQTHTAASLRPPSHGASILCRPALAASKASTQRVIPYRGCLLGSSPLLRSHSVLCFYMCKTPNRWTQYICGSTTGSSGNSNSGADTPLWHMRASAEETIFEDSRHCCLLLTTLLSSAIVLTVESGSRKRTSPVACAAAPAIAGASPHLACHESVSAPFAAFDSIPYAREVLLGPRRRSLCMVGKGCGSYTGVRSSSGVSSCSVESPRCEERTERRRRSCVSHRKGQRLKNRHYSYDTQCRWNASALSRGRLRSGGIASCAASERQTRGDPGATGDVMSLHSQERRSTKEMDTQAQQQQRQVLDNNIHVRRSNKDTASSRGTDQNSEQAEIQAYTRHVDSTADNSTSSRGRSQRQEKEAKEVASVGQSATPRGEQQQNNHHHHHHDSPLWRSEENRPFERKLEDALLFCGNSNQPLATAVADRLSTKLGRVAVKRFADGEVNIQFLDSLRGKDVYLIQPTSSPVNEHLMELLLMISTCRRASAKKITAVIPYYGYARQDRKLSSRVPISAADVARMIEAMGVDRVVAVDLHCGQIQGFFGPRVPVDNLEAQIIGLEYFQHKNLQKPVVVSPDAGGVYRARKFQEGLLARGYRDCGIAMLIKQRLRANEIERMDLVGSVEGSDVVIVDDMIDTAGTLCEAARELRAKGARRVFAFATHGLFSGPAIHRIESSPLEEVVVTDSIKARPEVLNCPRITSLSISVLLADAIRRIHQKESLNDLFMVKSWQ